MYSVMELVIITMETKNGKKLYLAEDKWVGKNKEKIVCKWTFDKNEALGFETEKDAKNFANEYFKNFTNYSLEWWELYDKDFR